MLRAVLLGSLGLIALGCGGDAFHTAAGGSPSDGGAENGGSSDGGRGGASTGGKPSDGGTVAGGNAGKGGGAGRGGSAGKGGNAGQGGTQGLGGASSGGTSSGGVPALGGTQGLGGTDTGGTQGLGGTDTGGTQGLGGTSTGGVGTGGLAGSGGSAGERSCSDLRTQYQTTLGHAKLCASQGQTVCTTKVSSDLFCGCPTFVNATNSAALAELDALSKEAAKRQCVVACPLLLCVLVESATCEVQASSGSNMSYACKDSAGLATE